MVCVVPGCRDRRAGFSLIELLAVVAIIAVLMALLLPAIQSARESARRTQCANNMRQIGIAMQGFEGAFKFFPPANSTGSGAMWPPSNPKEHGMFAIILPYIEEGSLIAGVGYDFNQNWSSTVNQPAAKTIISTYVCSSTPDGPRKITKAKYPTNTLNTWEPACNDYAPITGVEGVMYTALGVTMPASDLRLGMMQTNANITPGHVRDGLSNTLAIVECGSRPARIFNGRQMGVRSSSATSPCNVNNDTLSAAWADNGVTFPLDGANSATGVPNSSCYHTDATGRVPASGVGSGGRCVMNCTNWDEPYSFHPVGINGLFGDASVRFISDTIAPLTMIAIITRRGGESVGEF